MNHTGARLTPVEFGRALVQTGDLDPIYMMLRSAELPYAQRQRWSLAYWLFYHAGVATHIASLPSDKFWRGVYMGLDNKWPRGTERRHFRGAQSLAAVDKLQAQYATAEDAVAYITGTPGGEPQPFMAVKGRALEWWGFGEWISFKMADMTDAVLDAPVDFSDTEPHFFDAPRKGARLILEHYAGQPEDAASGSEGLSDTEAVVRAVTECLQPELATLRAPHAPERVLALQEYETILCKYKSHLNGHYPVGHDTKEILKALDWAPKSQLVLKLQQALQPTAG